MTKEIPNHFEDSIKYLNIPILDSVGQNLKSYLSNAINFIDDAHDNDGKILVHCMGGVSRSVSLVTAYLMKSQNRKLDIAYEMVKEKRSISSISIEFMGELMIWEKANYQ